MDNHNFLVLFGRLPYELVVRLLSRVDDISD